MIRVIGTELAAYINAKGCPLPVVDGPEQTKTTTWGRERIVLGHDDSPGSYAAARSTQVNGANVRRIRVAAYVIEIYAKSPLAGATPFEHRRRAEAILDTVLVGLEFVAVQRGNRFDPKSDQLFTPPDLVATELAGGAAMRLRFTFERAVSVRTFQGAPPPTGNVAGGLNSSTHVSLANNASPPPVETACGDD